MDSQASTNTMNSVLPARRSLDYAPANAVPDEIGWRDALGASGFVRIAILVALVAWLYNDHLVRLFNYWKQPDWSHGFLILPFSLYLIHMRRREILAAAPRGSLAGFVLIAASIVCYAWCIRTKFGYPQPLTMLGVIAGLVLLTCGWRILWLAAFPIAFLVLALPPPQYLYREITHPLQQAAAAAATAILNGFPGVREVERAGINIAYFMDDARSGTFTVAGACSGMRSLLAFVALGMALAYLTPRPLWHRVTLAVCVVPVALSCNVIRVIITGALQMYGRGDLATGTPHTLLGLIMFAVGFAIYSGILWTLDHLFVDESEASA